MIRIAFKTLADTNICNFAFLFRNLTVTLNSLFVALFNLRRLGLR
jgi:hypothetical protein